MKIEVNLSGIFSDEEGNEVHDSIKNEIIETVTEKVYLEIQKQIEKSVNEILTTGLQNQMKAHLDTLIPQLMDHEFTETTTWGEKKGTYTVRNRLLKALDDMCKYSDRGNYSSDKNAFTDSVKSAVEEKFKNFRIEYNKQVDAEFSKQALAHASSKLREALGIKL